MRFSTLPARALLAVFGVLIAVRGAFADESHVSRVIVPLVASNVDAAGVTWTSDVDLHNGGTEEVVVALTLPTAAASGPLVLTLDSGETVHFDDIVSEAFGLDSTVGPLVVATSAEQSVEVTAALRLRDRGEERTPQQIRAIDAAFLPSRSVFFRLDPAGTNAGFVNMSDNEARFELVLRRSNGQPLAARTIAIPPSTVRQFPLHTLFPDAPTAADLTLVADALDRDSYTFATTVAGDAPSSRFVAP